ncbi:MAG TPA: sn-glycerol-3-phosphate ABC transporter substrate-binding protein UgpB [Methylomirabilota bacterium]|nr:sn-glycerol-3-phosphate ABC transporter substrate-binding protein UgpB [Methylomirabilota bacterium]
MTRRSFTLLMGLLLAVTMVVAVAPSRAQQKVQVEFWHGLPQPLGGILEKIVADFNASQAQYQVNPSFKGSYPETMVGAIAAFRAGNAPHIVQMFDVGTATMMSARGAVKPVYELMKEAGVPFDPNAYVPAVKGYYSLPDGRMVSMPFNSSTTIMFYNKDAFKKAGLDPAKPPQTWPDLIAAARKIKAANAAPCAFTTAWPTWAQFEQFSAIHDVPLATKANGMAGLDAELKINSPIHVKHVQALMDMQKEGTFKYGGRDAAGDALFPSGECAIIHASSGLRARIMREAKFEWGAAMLPYWPGTPHAPLNSIIGGASFWVMTSPTRKPEEYKAVAEFFRYISQPDVVAKWHTDTGFLPVTIAGYEKTKASGYYQQNPGTDVPYLQLTRTQPTENSRGLRLGNMPEIRNIIQEELEKAFQGQQTAQQALDNAVQRGNVVLRNFERANRS